MFRRYPKREGGDIIAIFPDDIATLDGCVTVFLHIGGHGAGHYHHIMANTKPAKLGEYGPLKAELEGPHYNYNLLVVKRVSTKKERR
jgi:hypothetical protein